MLYLNVENSVECPVEGFTTLGLSTSRGKKECIGQFGSGNKHAVLLLLRNGLNPVIYSGTTKVQFYTEPAMMGEKPYNKVFVKIGNAKAKELSYCLEFGELDWNSLDMSLREIVSNAIDNGGFSQMRISVEESPRAKSGTTRVFIPLTPEVQKFYSSISSRFLYYTNNQEKRLVPKTSKNTRIYRKGVFVREIEKPSLFDYNFDDSVKIDEYRNMDDYTAIGNAAKLVSTDKEAIKAVLRSFTTNSELFEYGFSKWYLMYKNSEIWQSAWQETFGDAVCCSSELFAEQLRRKGHKCQVISNSSWMETLESYGIPSEVTMLSHIEKNGQEIVPTTTKVINSLNVVWNWLVKVNMTQGKSKPQVKCFSKLVTAEATLKGYYQNDCIYINVENDEDRQTMLEELSHYITGATDNSRDFQEFAFLFGKRVAELLYG